MNLHIRVNSEYIIMLCCKGLRCRIKNQIYQCYELHCQRGEQEKHANTCLYTTISTSGPGFHATGKVSSKKKK